MKCEICDNDLYFQWAVTHGIGQCVSCGADYQVYQYDENNNRLDLPPKCDLRPEYKEHIRRFVHETGHKIYSGHCAMEPRYMVAGPEDIQAFDEWVKANPLPELAGE